MQAGFAMLEVGIVHPKNAANILFKNLIDVSLVLTSLVLTSLVLAYPPAIPFPHINTVLQVDCSDLHCGAMERETKRGRQRQRQKKRSRETASV